MTFSLRRKRQITRPRARRTATRATISLLGLLLTASVGAAQTPLPGPLDWRPVESVQSTPQMPLVMDRVTPVQFKQPVPGPGGPEKLPEPKPLTPGLGSNVGPIGIPLGNRIRSAENEADFAIKTQPPGIHLQTIRLSEAQLYEQMRMESERNPGQGRIFFPEDEPVSTEPFVTRRSKPSVRYVEPNYVNHKPLLFEQKNWERYGWDIGPLGPVFELGGFFYDVVLLPYHLGSMTCRDFDTNAGKCLPGDPVPLLLYPERLSVTGAVFQAGTILGGLFIFP